VASIEADMSKKGETVDWDKVDEMALALMHLTTFEEHGEVRSWKGYDWGILIRMHERGWIGDPVSRAKAVSVSEQAQRLSRELFEKHFGKAV
jgi:hypothetical protein